MTSRCEIALAGTGLADTIVLPASGVVIRGTGRRLPRAWGDAANETQADCLRLIIRAELRMAAAIDAGQQRGEVTTREDNLRRGPDIHTSDIGATLPELGIDRRRPLRARCSALFRRQNRKSAQVALLAHARA